MSDNFEIAGAPSADPRPPDVIQALAGNDLGQVTQLRGLKSIVFIRVANLIITETAKDINDVRIQFLNDQVKKMNKEYAYVEALHAKRGVLRIPDDNAET